MAVWRLGNSYNQFRELANLETNAVVWVSCDLERSDWAQLRLLQPLMPDDTASGTVIEESLLTELDHLTNNSIIEELLPTITGGTQKTEPSDDRLPGAGFHLQHRKCGMHEAPNQANYRLGLSLPAPALTRSLWLNKVVELMSVALRSPCSIR